MIRTILAIVIILPLALIYILIMLIETFLYLSYKGIEYTTDSLGKVIQWIHIKIKGERGDVTGMLSRYLKK